MTAHPARRERYGVSPREPGTGDIASATVTTPKRSSRAIARALAADRREVAAATTAELEALCHGIARLSLMHGTGTPIGTDDVRAVMAHIHTLFVLVAGES